MTLLAIVTAVMWLRQRALSWAAGEAAGAKSGVRRSRCGALVPVATCLLDNPQLAGPLGGMAFRLGAHADFTG